MMPRKYFKKYLPSHDSVKSNRYIGLFGSAFHHHNLWHLHRRSVAGGVAVGLFTGLVPGPFQVLLAAIFALVFRVNLPVAVVVTFYTNPFTIVPLYLAAYKIGVFFVGPGGNPTTNAKLSFSDLTVSQWIPAFINWMASMGKPLAVGLPILATLLAICGYLLVRLFWRIYIIKQWHRRNSAQSD